MEDQYDGYDDYNSDVGLSDEDVESIVRRMVPELTKAVLANVVTSFVASLSDAIKPKLSEAERKLSAVKLLGISESAWLNRSSVIRCSNCGVDKFTERSIGNRCPMTIWQEKAHEALPLTCGGLIKAYTVIEDIV